MGWSAFRPLGNTVAIAVTTTASTGVAAPGFGGEPLSENYLVSNASTQAVFLAYGPPGVVAVAPIAGTPANGIYLGPNSTQSFTFGPNSLFSVIAPTGTSTVYITPGDGL